MKVVYTDRDKFEADIGSQKLIPFLGKFFEKRESCFLYHNFPTYFPDNQFLPSLVLVDKEFGVVVMRAYPYTAKEMTNSDIVKRLNKDLSVMEDYLHLLEGNVMRPKYSLKNKLKISPLFIFPFVKKEDIVGLDMPSNILLIDEKLEVNFDHFKKPALNDQEWRALVSIIQKVESITKNLAVQIEDLPQTISEAIIRNEQGISVFDDRQEEAALLIPQGGMRIRGIAGTGKTIILAWKAAYLHAHYPNLQILYTFGTKSLYNHIKKLVSIFYRKYSSEEINWDKLHVYHAWGGAGGAGVYSNACAKNNLPMQSMKGLRLAANPFSIVLKNIIDKELTEEYDYVLIDEAQDMPIEFFRLIEKITKKPKRVVVAYDELQSTEDVQMPNFEELFGYNQDKSPIIPLSEEYDIILQKSYRNHMRVLHTALAFGFGIYNKNNIIQILDREENWKSIGYDLKSGSLESGKEVEVERPSENSPNRIDKIFHGEDLISLNLFNTKDEEIDFVVNKIGKLTKEQGVRYEDIMIVNIDNQGIEKEFTSLRTKLALNNIPSKVPGFSDQADEFFIPGFVTISTVRRAKGNECPIVFVIGMNKISESRDKVSARIRRSFAFVSITRSKGWCYLSGSGSGIKDLSEEYERIMKDYPKLKFIFPSRKELEEIRKINYIAKDEKKIKEHYDRLSLLRSMLKSKDVYIPEDLKKQVKDFLSK